MRKKAGSECNGKGPLPKARVVTKFTEDCLRRRPVILKFSLQGVKMYSAAGETLLMAHALKRIFCTTCRPADRQFAFVARNPQSPPQEIFCHLFIGSQPSEVQVMNLLLCRTFQLHYLSTHREEQEKTLKKLPKVEPFKAPVIVREPLDPETISPNVNALISFRRLPFTGDVNHFEIKEEKTERYSRNSTSDSAQENPFGSLNLVRKKAIRSKVLRSGAYRCHSFETQQHYDGDVYRPSWVTPAVGACSCGSTAHLPESEAALSEAVWSFAGIRRDSGILLLGKDAIGAFLMQAVSGSTNKWTLTIRTQCGVVPYQILQTSHGTYCFEHLNEEFASLASLVAHHSGKESGLFQSLVSGRLNPSYEDQDLLGWSWTQRTNLQDKQKIIQEQVAPTELAS
ncbi:SH2 domain-containing protein 5 isoform X2 [Pleurodeles waltl]|uniref:SH2 domain-containing protein 5 isoform X2 n=1 Tax=Pleurodeles waltl TaxID=8319 RepID=UPI0037098A27